MKYRLSIFLILLLNHNVFAGNNDWIIGCSPDQVKKVGGEQLFPNNKFSQKELRQGRHKINIIKNYKVEGEESVSLDEIEFTTKWSHYYNDSKVGYIVRHYNFEAFNRLYSPPVKMDAYSCSGKKLWSKRNDKYYEVEKGSHEEDLYHWFLPNE